MGQTEGGSDVKRIIVGISGASGAIHGIRVLEVLRGVDGVEAHLVLSPAAGGRNRYGDLR